MRQSIQTGCSYPHGTRYVLSSHTAQLCSEMLQTVRYYDTSDASPDIKAKFDHRAAVLACTFSDDAHGYSGGLDTSVRQCVILTKTLRKYELMTCKVGSHY